MLYNYIYTYVFLQVKVVLTPKKLPQPKPGAALFVLRNSHRIRPKDPAHGRRSIVN